MVATDSTSCASKEDTTSIEVIAHEVLLRDGPEAAASRNSIDDETGTELESLGLPKAFAAGGRSDNSSSPTPGSRGQRATVLRFDVCAAPEQLPGFPPSSCTFCTELAKASCAAAPGEGAPDSRQSQELCEEELLSRWDSWFEAGRGGRGYPVDYRKQLISAEWVGSGASSSEEQWEIAWRFHTVFHGGSSTPPPAAAEVGCDGEGVLVTRPDSTLDRYWRQRYRLFSRFDQGVQLDYESWYSVTPEAIAQHIADHCGSRQVIVDAFCGSGGNAIAFASRCPGCRVLAVDIDPVKLRSARHNAEIYQVDGQIDFICADFLQLRCRLGSVDMMFLSPPWGGPECTRQAQFDLGTMRVGDLNGFELLKFCRECTPNIVYFLPRNTRMEQVAALCQISGETRCHVEKQHLNNKLKTITAYFGDTFSADLA